MPSVVHIVVTSNFAGTERHVANAALETARQGWEVAVVGGDRRHMSRVVGADVEWHPGSTASQALRSLKRVGQRDVCHAHMTLAEAVSIVGRRYHGAPVVSTRHFACRRGSRLSGVLAAPWIASRLASEIAVSQFVAHGLEHPPDVVIPNGVPTSPLLWRPSNRTVLVLQRLEREKDTWTALEAWRLSELVRDGWTLRVVGAGRERDDLALWADRHTSGVVFAPWAADVQSEFAVAGMLLAPAPAEPFGLSVLEAMASGVPVVAAASGGHLETVGRVAGAPTFPAGEAQAAAEMMRSLRDDSRRAALSGAGRRIALEELSLDRQVAALLVQYEVVRRARLVDVDGKRRAR